jgi:dephospho-CoA kinase
MYQTMAPWFDRVFPLNPQAVERLCELLPRQAFVVDVGCATGQLAAALRERGHRVVGLEPEPHLAELARGRGVPVLEGFAGELEGLAPQLWNLLVCSQDEPGQATAQDEPAPHTVPTFDAILSLSNVPAHFSPAEMERFLTAAARLLKPGGLLVLMWMAREIAQAREFAPLVRGDLTLHRWHDLREGGGNAVRFRTEVRENPNSGSDATEVREHSDAGPQAQTHLLHAGDVDLWLHSAATVAQLAEPRGLLATEAWQDWNRTPWQPGAEARVGSEARTAAESRPCSEARIEVRRRRHPLVAITGNIGAGKSAAAQHLRERGWTVIDADTRAHALYREDPALRAALAQEFGAVVLKPAGSDPRADGVEIDRAALARQVFGGSASAAPSALARLNALVHPPLLAALQRDLRGATLHVPTILDAALLFEWNVESWFDRVLLITAPDEERVRRIVARNHCTDAEAWERLRAQLPQEQKRTRLRLAPDSHRDTEIPNNSTIAELARRLDAELASTLGCT